MGRRPGVAEKLETEMDLIELVPGAIATYLGDEGYNHQAYD
jgi:hypothetical protein